MTNQLYLSLSTTTGVLMKSLSKLYDTRAMRLSLLSAILFTVASPATASAQIDLGSAFGKQISEALSKAFSEQMEAMLARKVNVTPAVAEIPAGSKTFTLELENPTDDTLTVNVVMSPTVPPMMRNPPGAPASAADSAKAKAPAKKTSILSDEDDDEKKEDDGTYMPMGAWIKGLPKKLVILPKAKTKVVVDVEIPADVAAGEYATWIAAEVEPRTTPAKPQEDKTIETGGLNGGGMQIKFKAGSFGNGVGGPTIISSAKILYKHASAK